MYVALHISQTCCTWCILPWFSECKTPRGNCTVLFAIANHSYVYNMFKFSSTKSFPWGFLRFKVEILWTSLRCAGSIWFLKCLLFVTCHKKHQKEKEKEVHLCLKTNIMWNGTFAYFPLRVKTRIDNGNQKNSWQFHEWEGEFSIWNRWYRTWCLRKSCEGCLGGKVTIVQRGSTDNVERRYLHMGRREEKLD